MERCELKLRNGYSVIVSEPDYELVSQYRWSVVNRRTTDGRECCYAKGKVGGKWTSMHRLILSRLQDISGFSVDHEDGNGLNNTRENLRAATQAHNLANQSGRGKQGFKGVYRTQSGKFVAQISLGRGHGSRYLGVRESAEEAARLYDKAAVEQYGQFARINFPSEHQIVPVEPPKHIPQNDVECPKNLLCNRCGHTWNRRKLSSPVACPRCKSPLWKKTRERSLFSTS